VDITQHITSKMNFLIFLYIFIIGLVFGSFLNVCIFRLPKHENIAIEPSHCQNCGRRLKWYELFPVFSYIALKGKCRTCHTKISIQYPIIELLNGTMYVLVFLVMGMNVRALLTCALTSCLIVIAVIDWRTFEIPVGLNVFIALLGVINLVFDYDNWLDYLIGAACVSGFLLIIYLVSKGRAMGGGDIKLMAAAGLLLGWKNIVLAFILGCILASVIHVIRMKVSKAEHVLAFGPYLAAGIIIAQLFGDVILNAYLSLCGL